MQQSNKIHGDFVRLNDNWTLQNLDIPVSTSKCYIELSQFVHTFYPWHMWVNQMKNFEVWKYLDPILFSCRQSVSSEWVRNMCCEL